MSFDEHFPEEPELVIRAAAAVQPEMWRPWKQMDDAKRKQWIRRKGFQVRVACNVLRAIEQPTEAMIEAGAAMLSSIYETDTARADAERIYRAMIKAWTVR